MARKQALEAALLRLAEDIVNRASGADVKLEDKIESLKVAGAFWLGARKVKLKLGDDSEDATPTFGNFKKLINGAGKEANA